jgi:hypothetical protein
MRKLLPAIFLIFISGELVAQCFSSSNPVGGTANLLTLNKKTIRVIPYYKYRYSNKYFRGNNQSNSTLYEDARYNYVGAIVGYGIIPRITMELETGYFINKTMHDKLGYTLTGRGLSNGVISAKFGLIQNNDIRLFHSLSGGLKFPFTTKAKTADGTVLDKDLQPSTRAFGAVFQSFLVKESSFTGYRFFLVNRVEINRFNPDGYRVGNAYLNSIYVSKHIIRQIIGGDWTLILQVRNEIREHDYSLLGKVKSSGGYLFFAVPQINFTLKERWNFSIFSDIPVYQYFNGEQLANQFSFGANLAFDIGLE